MWGIPQRTSLLSLSLYSELGFTKESWCSLCSAHRMVQEQCCHNQLEELHCATGINLASEPDGCASLHSYNSSLETIFIKVSKAEDHTRPPFLVTTQVLFSSHSDGMPYQPDFQIRQGEMVTSQLHAGETGKSLSPSSGRRQSRGFLDPSKSSQFSVGISLLPKSPMLLCSSGKLRL